MSSYPKYCEGCKVSIHKHDNHFSEVPGVGDLCNPCHREWAIEVEKIRGVDNGSQGETDTTVG